MTSSGKILREVKNQLSIDGSIDLAYNHIMLNMYDANALHATLVALAHLAAFRGYRAGSRMVLPLYSDNIPEISGKLND